MRVLLPVVPLTDNYLGIFMPNPFLINRFFIICFHTEFTNICNRYRRFKNSTPSYSNHSFHTMWCVRPGHFQLVSLFVGLNFATCAQITSIEFLTSWWFDQQQKINQTVQMHKKVVCEIICLTFFYYWIIMEWSSVRSDKECQKELWKIVDLLPFKFITLRCFEKFLP